jgi:hypothetical protein
MKWNETRLGKLHDQVSTMKSHKQCCLRAYPWDLLPSTGTDTTTLQCLVFGSFANPHVTTHFPSPRIGGQRQPLVDAFVIIVIPHLLLPDENKQESRIATSFRKTCRLEYATGRRAKRCSRQR